MWLYAESIMNVIEAPNHWTFNTGLSLFLGGGITDCPEWQKDVIRDLTLTPLTVLNPRRANFNIEDKSLTAQQIMWEFHYIRTTSAVMFWFPAETICPITLFELGARLESNRHSAMSQKLFIGTHPDYTRNEDVEIQSSLAGHLDPIFNHLSDLTDAIVDWNFENDRQP